MEKFKKFLLSLPGKITVIAVSAVVIYGILIACLSTSSMILLGITLLACGIFGWKALNKITPNIFLSMGAAAWAIYFVVKGLLSAMIGALIAPFQIAKMLTEWLQKTIKEIDAETAEENNVAYNVILVDSGNNKLNLVKAIKIICGLGLKEAKELVDTAPNVVKELVSKEEAERIVEQLRAVDGVAEIREIYL